MKKSKSISKISRLLKGEPLNIEERLEKLEDEMNFKLKQFEDSLALFRDVIIKLQNEKIELEKENALLKEEKKSFLRELKPQIDFGGFKEKIVSIKDKIKDIESTSGSEPKENPMERTVKWLREKYGIQSTKQSTKRKKK